jgi:hypothetical protein
VLHPPLFLLSVFAPQLSRSVINIGQLISETESSDDRSADLAALAILTLLILWFCSALIFSDQVPFFAI